MRERVLSDEPTTTGGCLCGASRFAFAGQPKFAIKCYCRDCQHVSGGGHAPQIAVARADAEHWGLTKVFNATSDKGNALEFGFCGECGSPLYKTTEMARDLIFFYVGALDNPAAIPQAKPVFEDSKQPWDN